MILDKPQLEGTISQLMVLFEEALSDTENETDNKGVHISQLMVKKLQVIIDAENKFGVGMPIHQHQRSVIQTIRHQINPCYHPKSGIHQYKPADNSCKKGFLSAKRGAS
ncbi:hypothetical protein PPACK8108_LOCUS1641 [Phakopsora pachyrhizi]|uniref:Uncharacterized protein n=1 Tax=Phakopsora pachyrhizi TaxID=170000 RepID=A0AAV0AJ02_PHAPC|nr:hypothetical protein PPACK8108_LOCUS1641 [Phakopsora pachyrhizi]